MAENLHNPILIGTEISCGSEATHFPSTIRCTFRPAFAGGERRHLGGIS
jgi:hypothetical protein